MVLAGCSGPTAAPGVKQPDPTTTVADAEAALAVRFTTLSFDLDAAATPPPGVAEAARTQVLATLDAYLKAATIEPTLGRPVGDLGFIFTPAAAGRLTGPDRAALVEEVLVGSDQVKPTAAVGLRALVGTDGKPVVMAALIDVGVSAKVGEATVRVTRQGTLVLVDEGGWKIDGYDVRTTRRTGAAASSVSVATLGQRPGAAMGTAG